MKESANQTEIKIKSFDSSIIEQSKKVSSLSSNATNLQASYNQLDVLVKNKIQNLKTLLSIYIVRGIKLNLESKPLKLYFNDMKPINATKMPLFKQKPIINIQTDNGLGVNVDELTNDYIIISPFHGIITDDTAVDGNVTIWFIEET